MYIDYLFLIYHPCILYLVKLYIYIYFKKIWGVTRRLLLHLPCPAARDLRGNATSAAVAFCPAPLLPSPSLRLVLPPLLAAAASFRRFNLPPLGCPRNDSAIRAAADAAASDEDDESGVGESAADGGSVARTAQLAVLFALWYLSNIYFNIYNKQVLKVYPFPLTITSFQFGLGSVIILLMWISNICKRPKLSSSQLMAILPLAILHTSGNLFTNMSLGKVAVSFTHTIKAMEPFFTVVLSAFFLGEMPSFWVLISLVLVVGGVALASLTEVSFNWVGFWSAMASNLTNQSRNVVSKKLMIKEEESVDNITLFSVITIMSFFLLAPVALIAEGIKFTPSFVQSTGLNLRELYVRSVLAALCFHAHQQVTYMVLARVSPVTHSVGNCVKRVVVIVSSVLFFNTPLSPINSLGTSLALAGVFLYSRVSRLKPKSA